MRRVGWADVGCLVMVGVVVTVGLLLWSRDEGEESSVLPEAVSAEGYQRVLTDLDLAAKLTVDQLTTASTAVDLGTAKRSLSDVLGDYRQKLLLLAPPRDFAQEHDKLMSSLGHVAGRLTLPDTAPVSTTSVDYCAVTPTVPAITQQVRDIIVWLTDEKSPLSHAIRSLAAKQLRVGAFLPPRPPPISPSVPPTSRPSNGKIVEQAGPRGAGRLRITNGTPADVALSVVTGEPTKPQVMIYVHGNSSATVTGISGDYQIYLKTGSGWSDTERRFTAGCAFEKFKQRFDQQSDWTIDLQQSVLGNARTEPVPPF